MEELARAALVKLLLAAEKVTAGVRGRDAALTMSHLKDYRSLRSFKAKESYEVIMKAARAAGAVILYWDDPDELLFIKRVDIKDTDKLAAFLGEIPLQERLVKVSASFLPHENRHPVLRDVINEWKKLKNVRGTGPKMVQDWLDAVKIVDYTQHSQSAIDTPIREASAALFKDSKRIEKLASLVDILLSGDVSAEVRAPSSVWQEIGLYREEQPIRMAGNVVVVRERNTGLLDSPYAAFHAGSIHGIMGMVTRVLTIENLTTFHSEARRNSSEPMLLIYTAGMPSPAWRSMYKRILASLAPGTPVSHWGDIDEGGFRIAALLASDAKEAGHTLTPWAMSPKDVPQEMRRPAKDATIVRMRQFAQAAGWNAIASEIEEEKITVEQEALTD